jgi:hypothetical protein
MTPAHNDKQQSGRNGGFDGTDFGFSAYAAMFDGMTKVGRSLGGAYAEMGQEWMSFLSRRFQEDVELSQRLVKCTTPQELTREWSEFFSAAAQEYQAEWRRLAELGSASVKDMSGAIGHSKGEAERSRQPN